MEPYIKEQAKEKIEHTNSIVIPEEMLVDNSKIEEQKEQKSEEKSLEQKEIDFIDLKEPVIEEKEEIKSFSRLIILSIIPLLLAVIIVGLKSNTLIKLPILIIAILLVISLIIGFIKSKKVVVSKLVKIIYGIFMGFYILGECTVLFLLYGPYAGFENWLVTTAMTTMNHQYFATWFYSDEEIEKVLSKNIIIESDEDSDLNLITVGADFTTTFYENKYEKEILTKEEGNDLYKIIKVSGKGYNGYLVAIYDPSRISVAATKYLNVRGEYVTDMAKANDAVLAINGGGFIDPNYSSDGGTPQGVVIKNGKVISDRPYYKAGGIIGITKENKLILGHISSSEALKKGVRDAVSFGPFLIVNGVKSFVSGNGGWGTAPRTAIGQRKDGIMLFLVLNGRTLKTPGADMNDLTEIMSNYGAYNASNLDGGTSSVLVFKEEIAKKYLTDSELKTHCSNSYCYINDPIDGGGNHETRWIATSIIVK